MHEYYTKKKPKLIANGRKSAQKKRNRKKKKVQETNAEEGNNSAKVEMDKTGYILEDQILNCHGEFSICDSDEVFLLLLTKKVISLLRLKT